MAVLPPTAASAMPSSVVGTSRTRTPRSQVAATNPARSVAAPPPMPTMQSDLVTPCRASRDHRPAAMSTFLAGLAVRHRLGLHGQARGPQRAASRADDLAEALGVDDHHGAGAPGHQPGQLAEYADADHDLVGRAAVGRVDVDPGGGHFPVISAAI